MTHRPFAARGRALAALVLAGALAFAGCSGAQDPNSSSNGPDGTQLLTIPREDMATFSRNFNPFSPKSMPMTGQAIYEPLFVFSPSDGKTTPWLATEWTSAPDGKSVTFTLRQGVKWSDGQPLTTDDVVYSFQTQKKVMGGFEFLDKVTADGSKITFTYNAAFSPGLFEVGQQLIMPRHIWEKVADPANELNADPVGTGPYTQVTNFQAQSYQLLKNPNYWQPDKQKIQGIRGREPAWRWAAPGPWGVRTGTRRGPAPPWCTRTGPPSPAGRRCRSTGCGGSRVGWRPRCSSGNDTPLGYESAQLTPPAEGLRGRSGPAASG